MRLIYNLLILILLVPYTVYWLGRALFDSSYRHNLGQRFGFSYPKLDGCIWIHAVSVGEVVAAAPLIRALGSQYPGRRRLVSTVTPTGATRLAAIFGEEVEHSYLPFEFPIAVNRFFKSVKPQIALIVETEIWPNLYRACGIRNIPLVLASARISPRSVKSYRKLLPLFRETLSYGIVIAAQGEPDAERFLSLGASSDRTRVTGNIKFDIELPADLVERGAALRRDVFGDRPVWIAASTHDKEEVLLLAAHRKLLQSHPDLLLVLVPRHPARFPNVRALLKKSEFQFVARTEERACAVTANVFLGDTMGEVLLFYAACDIAFVGGSLVPVGGHNLLEPAALGLPILTGPHVFNAQEIADRFVNRDACRMVVDADQLAGVVAELLADPAAAAKMGSNAREILEQNRGALSRLLRLIEPLLA